MGKRAFAGSRRVLEEPFFIFFKVVSDKEGEVTNRSLKS